MENNETAKELMLEEVISKAIQIPMVKVERRQFLAETFSTEYQNLEEIIEKGPILAGIEREKIEEIASKLILKRTSQSSVASFVTGMPGGLAMAATIPADVLQFFGMALRLAQELSYLYGAEDLWQNGKVATEKVQNQLILYCGVMFGVSGAVSGVRVLSTQVAKTTLKTIPQKALTKTFWYPILKKICKQIGVKMTKDIFAQGVSKAIPVIGGVISGSINFASMMPMATRLKDTLDKATFEYSEEEFNSDINCIMNIKENDDVEEKNEGIKDAVTRGLDSTKKGLKNFTSKFTSKNSNKSNDEYEEIKKLKELLDMQIITQEEFEKKKKELLKL